MFVGQDVVAEIRGEMARRNVRVFQLAARIDCHPTRLGKYLRGAAPMPHELARRALRELGIDALVSVPA